MKVPDRATDALHGSTRGAWSLSPGLADAALSSLAGFAASLYAIRFLEGPALGAYALYLAASTVAILVPQQLLFLPAQVTALAAPEHLRTALIRPTLLPGLALSGAAAIAMLLPGALLVNQVPLSVLFGLGAGAVCLILSSPLQDHIRSMMYLAGRPISAAAISGVQLLLTCLGLAALHGAGMSEPWIPLLALAIASTGSCVYGWLAARPAGTFDLPAPRELIRSGAALLPAAAVQELSLFLAAALLSSFASATALGRVEAARVVSRPVQVLSLGISRSLAPRLMEAGHARSRMAAKSAGYFYVVSIAFIGGAYLALVGWPHALNPVADFLPAAYELEGLTFVVLVASMVGIIAQLPRALLLGAQSNRELLWITTLASAARVITVLLTVHLLGAYALPAAQLASAAVGGAFGTRAAVALFRRA